MSAQRPAVADRIAWTYLATVLAAVAGGLLALIAYQVVNPLACPVVSEDAADLALTCSVGWAAVLTLLGFAAAFVGTLALFRIERRLTAWLATLAGLLWLVVGLAGIGRWWWILALVLLPALAALASAPWAASPRFRAVQTWMIAAAAVVPTVLLGWQLAAGAA